MEKIFQSTKAKIIREKTGDSRVDAIGLAYYIKTFGWRKSIYEGKAKIKHVKGEIFLYKEIHESTLKRACQVVRPDQ